MDLRIQRISSLDLEYLNFSYKVLCDCVRRVAVKVVFRANMCKSQVDEGTHQVLSQYCGKQSKI